MNNPTFVISLDFEKMWGVFDKRTTRTYGENIRNVDLVIDGILKLFEKYDIHATWATVGMLFHKDLQSCKNKLPIVLPQYKDNKLSSYSHLSEILLGDFRVYYSGLTSIKKISNFRHQEIATHTYSHFYCLEEGSTEDAFCKDLEMAFSISNEFGLETKSIVFPRNQYNQKYLELCSSKGINAFRGTEMSWAQKSRNQNELRIIHRIIRFLDSYINLTGQNVYKHLEVYNEKLVSIPASFFLRPYNSKLKCLEPLKMSRLKNSMLAAAKNNALFHLWWHPHNFGANMNDNLVQLESILIYYSYLHETYGMVSKNMTEVANSYK